MATVTDDILHTTKARCLNEMAEIGEGAQILLSIHPEMSTPIVFAQVRAVLHEEMQKRESLLKSVIGVCDALLRERGQA